MKNRSSNKLKDILIHTTMIIIGNLLFFLWLYLNPTMLDDASKIMIAIVFLILFITGNSFALMMSKWERDEL